MIDDDMDLFYLSKMVCVVHEENVRRKSRKRYCILKDNKVSINDEDFRLSFMSIKSLDFGRAFQAMKDGFNVKRKCWKDAYVMMSDTLRIVKSTDETVSKTYIPNSGDLMATDWMLI